MTTIQILVRNNESTIEKCINSFPLDKVNFIIGDLGSSDSTISICRKFTKNIIDVAGLHDNSKARQKLMDTSNSLWNFIIYPWEICFSGTEEILNLKNEKFNFKVSVVQGDVLTEEVRLISKKNKYKFSNPIFETIESKSNFSPIYLASSGRSDLDYHLSSVERWRKSDPLSMEPIYYSACVNLILKNWDNFINYGNMYVSKENGSKMPKVMTHYYLSMVYLYVKKDFQKAIKNLIFCIAKRPVMAEFWCLLADVFYSTSEYQKAINFYQIAMELGSQRLNHDDWPLEISKYKSYPEKMISTCESLVKSSKLYLKNNI